MAEAKPNIAEILCDLEEACIQATGRKLPEQLKRLLSEAKDEIRERDEDDEFAPSDSDARKFIYKTLLDFLSRERKIGAGAALCYPKEVLAAIRTLYPEGVKDYRPIAGKRKRLYEVSLEEMLTELLKE